MNNIVYKLSWRISDIILCRNNTEWIILCIHYLGDSVTFLYAEITQNNHSVWVNWCIPQFGLLYIYPKLRNFRLQNNRPYARCYSARIYTRWCYTDWAALRGCVWPKHALSSTDNGCIHHVTGCLAKMPPSVKKDGVIKCM